MRNMNSVSVNGESQINGEGVVYFNASFSIRQEGNYSSTKTITNKEMYDANREQCEADYAEFDSMAMGVMNQISELQKPINE